MRLTIEEVRHLAKLARISMTEVELEQMRDQMSNILENFQVLEQVDTEDVEPTGHAEDLESVTRADQAQESEPLEDMLTNAPRREEDFIRVRSVLE